MSFKINLNNAINTIHKKKNKINIKVGTTEARTHGPKIRVYHANH